ncbi:MAG: histidine kinase dimerization/phospho-acceptor domain-containing protein, partial [Pseudobdellovibrionaceae bacterium]
MTTTSNHLIFETKLRQRMIASMWAVAFLYPAWYYPCFKFFNAQEDLLGRCIVAVGAGLLALYFIFNKKLSLKKMEALFAGFVFLYTCQLLYLCNLNHWSFIYVLGCSMHCITVFPHVKNKKNLEYSFFAFLIVNLLMGYYYQVPTKDLIISEINIFIIFLCLSYLQYQNRILQNLLDSTLDDLAFSEKVRMQSAKLAALGTLAGGVAHEINNPMSIILGKTNLIARTVAKSDYTSSKLPEAFSKIEQTLSRMTEILKGLMIFAKNEYEEKENKISLL